MLRRMSAAYDKNKLGLNEEKEKKPYEKWNIIAKGNYGQVAINPEGTRAVKTLLTGADGKKGEFGPHEVELAKKMGELGHSPKVYSSSANHIEMDVAKGNTLWKDYKKGEDEPVMNSAQASKAAAAIRDLHKMGYAHGDLHALQFLVDGNNVKLVDYGLSVPTSSQPSRVMQDLAKINGLINWKNPELANSPYFQLVNKYLDQYNEVKGYSAAAKAKRAKLGEAYLKELKNLKESSGPEKSTKNKPEGLFTKGSKVDIYKLEQKAEAWRQKAGLNAFPMTFDWKHDLVHVLTHEFLGGSSKIGEWVGQGPKSPTPAEETLVNMVHRAASLKARGDSYKLSDSDLARYFNRDIQFMLGRGDIKDKDQPLYFKTNGGDAMDVNTKKFIAKYREMENTPGFDKLLDASHSVFINAGDIFL